MWQLVLKYIPMDCSNFINSISLKVHVHVGIYMLNGVACLVLKKYSRPPPTPPPHRISNSPSLNTQDVDKNVGTV